MKRLLASLLSLAIMFSMAGCESKNETGEQPIAQKQQEQEVVKTNTLDFSDFNMGNNPNNFDKCRYSPAFDDEYIYYFGYYGGDNSGRTAQDIFRMDYQGKNKTLVAETSTGCKFLNCYEGNLYYAIVDYETVYIYRINTETFKEECVYEGDHTYSGRLDLYTMIVYEDYIFYAYRGEDMRAGAYAIDINTFEAYELYQEDYEPDHKGAVITFDKDDNIYLYFTKYTSISGTTSEVYKCNIADITAEEKTDSAGWGIDKLELVANENDLDSKGIVTPNGYMWAWFVNTSIYNTNEYAHLGEEGETWAESPDKSYKITNSDDTLYSIAKRAGDRWLIGDSMVIMNHYQEALAEFYIVKNFNFENMTKVCDSTYPQPFSQVATYSCGVYNGKMYVVELSEINGDVLTVIDSNGGFEKFVIE